MHAPPTPTSLGAAVDIPRKRGRRPGHGKACSQLPSPAPTTSSRGRSVSRSNSVVWVSGGSEEHKIVPYAPAKLPFRLQYLIPKQVLEHRKRTLHRRARESTIPSKGFGLVARRKICRGEEILRERPFIVVRDQATPERVKLAFDNLLPEKRILFLSYPWTIGPDVFLGVVNTNAIPCHTELASERLTCGIFQHLSRINHSCAPNTVWRWQAATKEQTLFALRDIEPGEELTASYFDVEQDILLPRDERQRKLQEVFEFKCMCDACDVTEYQAYQADRRLETIKHNLDRWADDYDLETLIWDEDGARNDILKVLELVNIEQRFLLLDTIYEHLFHLEAAWANYTRAKDAGRQCYDAVRIKLGQADADLLPIARWKEDPQQWDRWAVFTSAPISQEELDDGDYHEDSDDEGQGRHRKRWPRSAKS